MTVKKKLIKTVVDKAEATLGADTWIWDTELDGFGLRVKPTGRKIYVVRYRNKSGVQRKMKIARSTDMPPEKARDLARKVFAQVAEGQDPAAEARPEKAVKAACTTTVEKLFEAYVKSMRAKDRCSADEVERALLLAGNNAADALGRTKPAADVKAADVVDYVASIFKTGCRGAADKHRSYIRSAFAWAIKSANDYTVAERQNWGVAINPAADVPKDSGATGTRDRNLTTAELKKLWQATRPGSPGFAPETAVCVRMLIACGQRVQETLRMDGCEIDFEAALWKIPAHKTKGRKHPHTIPLPKQILPDLQLLVDIHGSGPLFPGRDGNALMHHSSVLQALDRWMTDAKVPDFQTRDLRRTWKSRAHDAGVDRFTRDLIQQHAKNDTGSKHYDLADYLPQMREAMTKWGDWIDANLEDPPELKLVA